METSGGFASAGGAGGCRPCGPPPTPRRGDTSGPCRHLCLTFPTPNGGQLWPRIPATSRRTDGHPEEPWWVPSRAFPSGRPACELPRQWQPGARQWSKSSLRWASRADRRSGVARRGGHDTAPRHGGRRSATRGAEVAVQASEVAADRRRVAPRPSHGRAVVTSGASEFRRRLSHSGSRRVPPTWGPWALAVTSEVGVVRDEQREHWRSNATARCCQVLGRGP
jgi:hypothetical protein